METGGKRYDLYGNLQTTGERVKLVCEMEGVRTFANVVISGNAIHLFTAVSVLVFCY